MEVIDPKAIKNVMMWINMRKNIGKLPHLLKREGEEGQPAEGFHTGERNSSSNNSLVRNPAITGKLMSMSMRQYSKKGK